MKKFLEVYRGAVVYEVEMEDPSEGHILGTKVIATAMLPEPSNMKVDFAKEAGKRKEALEKIKKEIDLYLEKHELDEFVHENL